MKRGLPFLKDIFLCRGNGVNPHENLALEQMLLEACPPDSCILYLWQNQNTVVIGRNQNPWRECRLELLSSENGTLARRLSGGGAVFHDLGNLNFTFLTSQEHYDVSRQLSVIVNACRSLGIQAEISGRNDILAQGQKFSGNAFYQSHGMAYHHGTLLVSADFQKLQRYLSPSPAKLQAKGVASVRSRVINLSSLCPELTCSGMARAMEQAFGEVYGLTPTVWDPASLAGPRLAELTAHNGSWQWLYGTTLPFHLSCADRFSWGEIELQLQIASGTVAACKVYTDAMDWQLSGRIEAALPGCAFTSQGVRTGLERAFPQMPDICADLTALLQKQM